MVHEGDALFHIARFEEIRDVAQQVGTFQAHLDPDDLSVPNEPAIEPPII